MGIFARLLEELYRVDAKYRCALIVVGATALVPWSLVISQPALALDECGALVLSSATCTPTLNPYAAGIGYDTNNGLGGTPITLTLQSGVNVVVPAGAPVIGGAVNAANTTAPTTPNSADITIIANGVTIDNSANSGTSDNTGLRIQSSGAATITATNTNIDVLGTQSNDGILAIIEGNNPANAPKDVTVTWTGQHITSSGANSTGIQADNRGNGNASIDASGDISGRVGTSTGFTFLGLDAVADDTDSGVLGGRRDILGLAGGGLAGDASVIYRGGTINVQATLPPASLHRPM
jgi:hypothetical protein